MTRGEILAAYEKEEREAFAALNEATKQGATPMSTNGAAIPTASLAPPPPPLPGPPILDPEVFVADAPTFPPAVIAALATPVDPELVETRATKADGPEKLLYVPWVHYQTVLLKAFGPGGYRMVPRGMPRTEGSTITCVFALFVRSPGEKQFQFIKEAKGECGMHGGMTPGNAAEGAQSDALVKCCKALGIFMELFDPRWRRAWEAKYRPTHEREKRSAAWPAARDAGQASPSEPSSSATTAAPSGDTAAPSVDAAPPSDTGEAASEEQKAALVAEFKAKKWKGSFVRIWVKEVFGVHVENGLRAPEALTQVQADAAVTLLIAHGTPLYDRLLARWRETGSLADAS